MGTINTLFRERINFPRDEKITFEKLHTVLDKTAKTVPFENLSIIEGRTTEQITEDYLVSKILERKEGGLCYELNPILHLFLKENGFESKLVLGSVYSEERKQWSPTGKTHVVNLMEYEGEQYLVETGFGGNLPLSPVPMNGETIISHNGEFRVEKENTPYGDYVLYMKIKDKHTDWKIGYTFDSKRPIRRIEQLTDIYKIIKEHEESNFNKRPLVNMLTNEGSITLTNRSFTKWVNGKQLKYEIEENEFKEIKEKYFSF